MKCADTIQTIHIGRIIGGEMGKMIKGWKCAECGREWYTEDEASACFLSHRPANVMDNGRVGAILDRLQERLRQDPDGFEDLLDRIEEVI